MLAFAFSPIGKIVSGLLVALVIVTTVYQVGRSDGREALIDRIEEKRDLAVEEIEELREDVANDANIIDRANRWLRPSDEDTGG